MHRMCKIIHTDFKPENVVIGLREDEVAEIASTGQLTTSKMFEKGDHIKKLNMKVAGTLDPRPRDPKPAINQLAEKVLTKVWDVNMEGLTAKQKKNLRKKLAAKRRKERTKNADVNTTTIAVSEMVEGDEEEAQEINEVVIKDPIQPEAQKKSADKKKKRVINGSLDMTNNPNGFLFDDLKQQQ